MNALRILSLKFGSLTLHASTLALILFSSAAVPKLSTAASDQLAIESPNARLRVSIELEKGVPYYTAQYQGRPLTERSRLGLGEPWHNGFRIVSSAVRENSKSWKNHWGERSDVPDNYRELLVNLEHSSGSTIQLQFRVYDEGIAFRYHLPDKTQGRIQFRGENTEFRFPSNTFCYEEHGTEGPYVRVPVSEVRPWCERPLVLEFEDGMYAALTEAGNSRYPRMLLSPSPDQSMSLVTALGGNTSNTASPNQRHDPAAALGPGDSTPWRALIVGDSPGDLLERNYLLLNLNPPCRIADASWIKPGKVMRDTTLTTANAQAIIDFAAQAGLQYVHLDWKWYGSEDARTGDATKVRVPDLDIEEIVRYGEQHGVGLIVYVDRRQIKRQRDALFPLYEKWGIKGVKIGFVDVGPQAESEWVTETIAKAAEHHLMLNIHDGYRTTGINRTWPNLMTVEGIRGNEHMPTPEHNCTLPFTRYVDGPGDYTVCYYNDRIQTTHAHQLAMAVVSFSPLQWLYWYDSPDMYHDEPEIEFFRKVPTVWYETKVVNGVIGQFATIARRSGDDWFVGTINNSEPRQLKVPLNFLTAGKNYIARIYSDDPSTTTRTKVGIETSQANAETTLSVDLLSGGGQAIWLSPVADEEQAERPSAQERPSTTRRPVDYVNPLIDTHNSRWFYFSSACRPFGMVNLSPDTRTKGTWQSGYLYGDNKIRCFSHIHSWQMAGIPVMATSGKFLGHRGMDAYQSTFSHEKETARPGYHRVVLDRYGITAELTSTTRVGFHRYSFPAGDKNYLLFDTGAPLEDSKVVTSEVQRISDTEIAGFSLMGSTMRRPKDTCIYFVAQFSRPFQEFGGWMEDDVQQDIDIISGENVGAFVRYELSNAAAKEPVLVKVGISYTSVDQARLNLGAELPHWDFDRVQRESTEDWNNWLSRILVEGGSEAQRIKFYTDLWHALLGRRIVSDLDGKYCDMTGPKPVIRQKTLGADGKPRFAHHCFDALWGSHWSLNILWSLAYPEVMDAFCDTMVDMYRDGGLIPRGPAGGNYTYVMIGDPAAPFFATAYNKGIRTYDAESAYAGLRKNAFPGGIRDHAGYEHSEIATGGGMKHYVDRGYVPEGIGGTGIHRSGAAMTLEYAYQDWCLAQFAKSLGKQTDYELFLKRSQNYRNLWDPELKLMRPRMKDGSWMPDFQPVAEEGVTGAGFVESNTMVYSNFVPHDMAGLIGLFGGQSEYATFLDESFNRAAPHRFLANRNHAGVYVDYENQPGTQMAHLFNYCGAPWLSQKWVREVKEHTHGETTPYGGYNGDEDEGQMGALGVLMAIGLFEVDGGASVDPIYEITSPVFDHITIQLHKNYYPGRRFEIVTQNNSRENAYIQSARLNQQRLDRCWFRHRDLAAGGKLEITLGPQPNRTWGITEPPKANLATTDLVAKDGPEASPVFAHKKEIYHDGWIDLNKSGIKDPYEDPAADEAERVEDLLSRMTLDEKTAQMATLYGFPRVLQDELPTERWKSALWKDGIGNIDEHCNGNTNYGRKILDPESDLPHSRHAETMNEVQRFFIEHTRLGIPADMTNEGIRGLLHTHATSFPSQLGVAATFSRKLASEIGHVVGREAKALGYSHLYAPILDLPRDPRWGRSCECYSEDPYLTSELGVAMIRALQSEKVGSTCKHFAVYGVPNGGRDGAARADPQVPWRDVQSLHLVPFRRAIQDAHAMGVMASYNDYDGVPIEANHRFLTEILRRQWGFDGYIVSDSGAVRDLHRKHHIAASRSEAIRLAVEAGLNVRTDFDRPENFVRPLRDLLKQGQISERTIDDRVRDVLRIKFRLGLMDRPYVDSDSANSVVGAREHRAVAARAARESIVLLKNEGQLLPLDRSVRKILVTGPLANDQNAWWDRYGPQRVDYVTPLEGICEKLGDDCEVRFVVGCDVVDERYPESDVYRMPPTPEAQRSIDAAVSAASDVDAIIAVLGEDESISREDRSRVSLDLPGYQEDLLRALAATGKPIVLVISSGRPLSVNWAADHVPAIVEMWFSNEEGGRAIADVLFGDYNPSGRLPVTFPRSVGQIPIAFPFRPAAQAADGGQVSGPLFPFGHGLSYTSFKFANLHVVPTTQISSGTIEVTCEVTNTGRLSGDEIVQLYVRDEFSSVTTFDKSLRDFERVHLEPGEMKSVRFLLQAEELAIFDDGEWTVEPGTFTVMIGASSTDIRLTDRFEIVSPVDRTTSRTSFGATPSANVESID